MRPIRKRMHIDRPNKVSMSGEAASAACPISPFGLLAMPTSGTLARCSSFGASEAQDVNECGFVGEIVDIFAILPAGHTLVVMPAFVLLAYAVRITDEEAPHGMLNTKVYDLSSSCVTHISHTPGNSSTDLVLSTLQVLPAPRILLTAGLLLGNLAQLLIPLPLEATDTTTRDNHRLAGLSGDCCKMDLTQINGRTNRTRRLFCLWVLNTYVQFKTVLPDQGTGSGFCWHLYRQDERLAPFAHRQYHPPTLFTHGLGRPMDWIEAFRPPGVFHPHYRMGFTQLAGRVDRSKEGPEDRLNRLALQLKTSPGDPLHLVLPRPRCMLLACVLVQFATRIPHLSGFHLGRFQPLKKRGRKVVESIDLDGLHAHLFFFIAQKAAHHGMSWQGVRYGRGSFHPAPWNGAGHPASFDKLERPHFTERAPHKKQHMQERNNPMSTTYLMHHVRTSFALFALAPFIFLLVACDSSVSVSVTTTPVPNSDLLAVLPELQKSLQTML
jgi:hypothetical protein